MIYFNADTLVYFHWFDHIKEGSKPIRINYQGRVSCRLSPKQEWWPNIPFFYISYSLSNRSI